jgi:hypothetical protein
MYLPDRLKSLNFSHSCYYVFSMNFKRKPDYLSIRHELICRYAGGCIYLLCGGTGSVIYYFEVR